LKETILFTIVGCKGCEEIKNDPEFKDDILKGIIKVKECDPNDRDKMKTCIEAEKKDDFDGYPSLYNEEGKKLI